MLRYGHRPRTLYFATLYHVCSVPWGYSVPWASYDTCGGLSGVFSTMGYSDNERLYPTIVLNTRKVLRMHVHHDISTVLSIPHGIQDIPTVLMMSPMVLKISPTVLKISTIVLKTTTVLSNPHGTEHTLYYRVFP